MSRAWLFRDAHLLSQSLQLLRKVASGRGPDHGCRPAELVSTCSSPQLKGWGPRHWARGALAPFSPVPLA